MIVVLTPAAPSSITPSSLEEVSTENPSQELPIELASEKIIITNRENDGQDKHEPPQTVGKYLASQIDATQFYLRNPHIDIE